MTRPAGYRPVRDPFALRYLTHPVGGRRPRPHRRWIVRVIHTA